ncbi:MAG: ribonucleotide-diphosphate reductase subunit beta [Candidatus Sericytochromatia bacterium]|nr:ribonucleotide-diphosphate reductase subunit beta [Candidatus Sericytochromatia bacterium]
MNELKIKPIFNPNGDDSLINRRIINGSTTNLFNLNEIKYTWAKSLYRVMLANFWIPEKVDLSQDTLDYQNLNEHEKKAFESILSFLTFLDSIQTNNIPNIANYITAPEVRTLLAIQEYQEVIHSQSYAYILESIIPIERRNKVYELWRTDDILFDRNKYIAGIYQDFINSSSNTNFARVMVANYILESLYFYNGFIFFYNLATKHVMLGTADEIRYINRDELTHIDLFVKVIKTINQENDNFITQELVHEMFAIAAQQEIEWTNYILGNNIAGMDTKSTEKYTKYLVNQRIVNIGFEPLYPGYNENPYQSFELMSDNSGESVKSNFFESTVTNYSQATAIEGWDEI